MNRAHIRQSGLLVVVFVATLVLLVGGWALVSQSRSRTGSPSPSSVAIGSGGAGAGSSSSASSAGPPSSGRSGSGLPTAVVTGAGDIADCARPGAVQTSDLLVHQSGTIFTAGDNAYKDGSTKEFADCYQPTWGRVKDRTLPAPGNHDYQTADAAGYVAYFGAAATPDGTTWYSTDLGLWHVIVLDSDCSNVGGCDLGSPQGRWLAADLKAHVGTRCTLAIWHHPRFSSGQHGNDASVGPFWEQLVTANADLVINGHDHDYERFAPQDAAGKADRKVGLREFVVGTGGAELRAFKQQAANSEFRLAGVWGVIRLTLHPANYDWEFLPTTGSVTDSGSALCH
jgi:hypothetical protein